LTDDLGLPVAHHLSPILIGPHERELRPGGVVDELDTRRGGSTYLDPSTARVHPGRQLADEMGTILGQVRIDVAISVVQELTK